jgi:non-ribosomal peptide synthetase component F/thioesterase domain-containing protein
MTDFTQPANPQPESGEQQAGQIPAQTNAEEEVFAFPLSPAQRRMWSADEAQVGNPAYNASFRWSLIGPLQPSILERAFNEIVRRHEILRATFTRIEGEPLQLIAPSLELSIETKDLRYLPVEQREVEMDQISAQEARRRFNLKTGPLVRLGLLRLDDQRYVLMLTLHHIVSDGWSIGLIMEELQKIYSAYAEGREAPLPELRIQYPDYVVWQREELAREEVRRQLAYWKKKLAGYQRLEVPGDLSSGDERTSNSAIATIMLPRLLSDALRDSSNQQGSTMFITTLAACMMLLRRYTGKSDIAVGSPLAGRNRTDLEGLIGLFVNQVVFRSQDSADLLFTEFLAHVRETVWEAFANQEVPFEDVVRAVQNGSEPYSEPLYLINFICQREYARASAFVFEFAGIQMSTMPSKSQGALYDLNFFIVEREAGWRLSLEYRADRYSESAAEQMLGHFRELLEGIVANPNRRISEFLLSGGGPFPQRASPAAAPLSSAPTNAAFADPILGDDSNSTEVYKMPASVAQERFWLLAKLAPGNPAFHMPACVRLAGTLSGAVLEKSFQMLVDRHETLRTAFEETDGELAQIITVRRAFSLIVTDIQNVPAMEREARLQQLVREETQRPFDLVRGPLFRAELFRLQPEEHVLVVTVHHILADGWSQNVLQRELWSVYEALTQGDDPSLPSLAIQYSDFTSWQKDWLASGEAREHLDYWTKQLGGPLPVLNFPTDRLPSNRPASHGAIETLLLPEDLTRALKSLGQSENVTMFMLTLACFGVLQLRYTNQEDVLIGSPASNRRTETEPLIGPFAGPFALRLNLSGNPTFREVLRRVRDVTIDALSHTDLPFEVLLEKLKPRSVHGRNPLFQFYFLYQTAFLQPRRLKQLTVTPMATFSMGTPFEMQLALIERQEGARAQLEYNPDLFDQETIQGVLRYYETTLRALVSDPDQHVLDLQSPSRRNSPALPRKTPEPAHDYIPPRDGLELELVQIWQKTLGQSRVGVRDDFFELGGHSLLAARLLARIQQTLGKELSLASLLDAPTIERQARLIRGSNGCSAETEPTQTTAVSTEIPLFYLGGDPTFRPLSLRLSALHEFHSLGMQASFVQDLKSPFSLETIARHFVKAIRERCPEGPYMLGGWCSHGLLALETAQQLRAQGQEIALVVMMETANPVRRMAYPQWKRMISRMQLKLDLLKFEFVYLKRLSRQQVLSYVWGRITRKASQIKSVLRKSMSPLEVLYAAADHYHPERYDGPVVLFRSVEKSFGFAQDMRLGWGDMLGEQLEICEVPGSHYTFYIEPRVEVLAHEMNARMKNAQDRIRRREASEVSPRR